MLNKKTKDSAILQNRIHSNNCNEQSVPKNSGFDKFFFLKLSDAGTEEEGKKKKEEVRNDDKKMKQIRIFLYQLYPIYKIQNSKY